MKKPKIETDKFYSLGEIVREGLVPGVDTIPKASRLVNGPMTGKILKAKAVKRGARGIQYKIKGINLLEYLQHEKAQNNT